MMDTGIACSVERVKKIPRPDMDAGLLGSGERGEVFLGAFPPQQKPESGHALLQLVAGNVARLKVQPHRPLIVPIEILFLEVSKTFDGLRMAIDENDVSLSIVPKWYPPCAWLNCLEHSRDQPRPNAT
jgi:hypothetical protein